MVGRALALPGGLEHQAELLPDPDLPDHLVEGPRPQGGLDHALVALGLGGGRELRRCASSAASR